MKTPWQLFTALAFGAVLVPGGRAQGTETYELPPINYSRAQPRDVVSRLRAEIASGALKLEGTDREVVQTLLRRLHISPASQLLVFSKTSFQNNRISPGHPRALYYTDDCYIGWVPGGLVEVAAIDPQLGPVFYSLDPRAPAEKHPVEFSRQNDCLRCHGGQFVPNIPGVFARSVYADENGEPLYRQGTEVVDYRTPFVERWGGWYVTGIHGNTLHRGNVLARENGEKLVFDPAPGANVTNLSAFFSTGDYLTNSSDIVSLLVFEHQTAMQNALTRAGINCRHMLDYQKRLQEELKEPATDDEPSYDSVRSVFDHAAAEVVDSLLFKDEATLPDSLAGSPAFQNAFAADARRARDGSSLKDLLLSDHLFKTRCSYLIYSESFLSLPRPLKQRIVARLAKALDADHPDPRYDYIHRSERRRIAAILRETHPDFKVTQTAETRRLVK